MTGIEDVQAAGCSEGGGGWQGVEVRGGNRNAVLSITHRTSVGRKQELILIST